jgi:hypothetical protein
LHGIKTYTRIYNPLLTASNVTKIISTHVSRPGRKTRILH